MENFNTLWYLVWFVINLWYKYYDEYDVRIWFRQSLTCLLFRISKKNIPVFKLEQFYFFPYKVKHDVMHIFNYIKSGKYADEVDQVETAKHQRCTRTKVAVEEGWREASIITILRLETLLADRNK